MLDILFELLQEIERRRALLRQRALQRQEDEVFVLYCKTAQFMVKSKIQYCKPGLFAAVLFSLFSQ